MSDSLCAGTLTLPFTRADFRRLALLERSLQTKASTGDAPLSHEEEEDIKNKVEKLKEIICGGENSEEEWREVLQMDEGLVYRGLLVVMSLVPLPPDAFDSLAQCITIVASMDPARVYTLAVAHPAAVEKLLLSISSDLDVPSLAMRFRLLDLLLVEGASHPEAPLVLPHTDFDDVQQELMECLANSATHVFALTTSSMLLLDHLDTRRSLHRVLMGKQAELAVTPSSAAAAARSPGPQLTTASLSRFSQELITLVNAGRLPPQWEEEGEVLVQRSGTDRERRGSVEDLYTSQRTEIRTLPDRDPSCNPVTAAALQFLSQLFATNSALDLLYTNDIQVLVEVIVRRVEDEQEDVAMTLSYLLALSSIVSWNEFVENPFRVSEIKAMIRSVQSNYPRPAALTDAQREALSPAEAEEAENKLAVYELVQIMQTNVDKI